MRYNKNMSGVHKGTLLLLLVMFLLAPVSTHAQLPPEVGSSLVVRYSPEFPKPGQEVRITVESFSIDLNQATISWFVDKTLRRQGAATKEFTFTVGPLGSESTIDVTAGTGDGVTVGERIVFRPTNVDLLWQAQSFVPPFYSGKALPTASGSITVEAVPNFVISGKRLSPDTLIYTWKYNEKVAQSASGKGKRSLTITDLKPERTSIVDVEIASPDRSLVGTERLVLPLAKPKVIVYEDYPLLGTLFNRSVRDSFFLAVNETRFIAYPYFMSLRSRNDTNLEYLWHIDQSEVALGEDPSSITVSHEGDGEGNARVTVSIQNLRNIFQQAEKSFTVQFGR